MTYFKINNVDFSNFVKSLKVNKENVYNSQTNANGDTVVDYINSKKTLEVGVIPLNGDDMKKLLTALNNFNVSITFRNPSSGVLETINAISPNINTDYYTIQSNTKVLFREFVLQFVEL
jgi:hypothetical protein